MRRASEVRQRTSCCASEAERPWFSLTSRSNGAGVWSGTPADWFTHQGAMMSAPCMCSHNFIPWGFLVSEKDDGFSHTGELRPQHPRRGLWALGMLPGGPVRRMWWMMKYRTWVSWAGGSAIIYAHSLQNKSCLGVTMSHMARLCLAACLFPYTWISTSVSSDPHPWVMWGRRITAVIYLSFSS